MEITQEVKAVRDLGRLRCPFGGPARILRRAITGNHFDAWMVAQPGRHRLGCALRQEIDRPLLFEIHQDCAIDAALAERKIIDPEHAGSRLGGRWGTVENTQDRVTTERHPQARRHPCASFAPCLAAKDADQGDRTILKVLPSL
jgi:hypothetical protein